MQLFVTLNFIIAELFVKTQDVSHFRARYKVVNIQNFYYPSVNRSKFIDLFSLQSTVNSLECQIVVNYLCNM